ncbi:hypothetical protein BCR39DRAFT_28811 [Naematelia encephala]|uniref:RING-type domain-containing protein n=1 Tax=Naematelia encephala TaxID=71784 RepID=A0A1Y2BLQ3_9TREE|nr:hypothetical protein BCR39DRAFT_28811 [Naematelia encephala]
MPLLASIGARFSQILHDLVFSFPSPADNATHPGVPSSGTGGGNKHPGNDGYATMSGLEGIINEPGEPRALAGGVGPLSFAGSGYGVMLVLMALLLNRIHHIVRRPRPPVPPLPHPPTTRYYRFRAALAQILTSPQMPKYLRLPGLICLIRAWALFTVLTLQVANLWPVAPPSFLGPTLGKAVGWFGQWAGSMEMEKACWQVFLSVCAGLVCSGLANGLDRGRRRDVGAGFNLFGYSFLLHLYSSPLTHHRPPPAANHGRPDVHALFQLWLSLTELTWLQAIELSQELRRNQLLPTAVCGIMGLTHFVYALGTSPLKFPSFTFLTHLMALFLSTIIIFSIVVKAFTHIFTLGYLPSPIMANLLPHEGLIPSIEDDFGVCLLKLGTACLEATQYSGLRNELVPIEERMGPWVELSAAGSDVFKGQVGFVGGFNAEITNIEVSELEDPQSESVYWRELRTFWHTCGNSLVSLGYKTIVTVPGGKKAIDLFWRARHGRWWYGPRQWRFWRRAAWATPTRFRRQAAMRALDRMQREHRELMAQRDESRATSSAVSRRQIELTPGPETPHWSGYLLGNGDGDVDMEDDGEEWMDEDDDGASSSSSGASDSEEQQQDLYQDLLRPALDDAEGEIDLQPVLLAHMTSSSGTPLTRRRYNAILSTPTRSGTPQGLSEVVADRRLAVVRKERDEWDDDRRRMCVVCTIEPRDTILWPCRCLALCNECRESLASRLAAKDHMCPCCRRK